MSENVKLYDLPVHGDPKAIFEEVRHVAAMAAGGFDFTPLEKMHQDVVALFDGRFPGYRASNAKYHDLEHTDSVVLASVRVMHGLALRGEPVEPRDAALVITAALLHDVGLIQTADDLEGTGAKYAIGHEERSVAFARTYLASQGWTPEDIEDCARLIRYTNLNLPVEKIAFPDEKTKRLAQIVASADLLAQMADRTYLEKLLLLFKEFDEAGIPGFDSELDLLKKTGEFYEGVAKRRLRGPLENVAKTVRFHFAYRWSIDRDLYLEAIENNIDYLKEVLAKCEETADCVFSYFKRGGIVGKLNGE